MKKISLFSILCLILIISACGQSNTSNNTSKSTDSTAATAKADAAASTPASSKEIKIGYAINTLNNPFFVAVKDGADKEAAKQGVKLSVVDANNDLATQLKGVEDLIQQKIDILILDPVDSAGTVPAVEAANKAGIRVITTGRQVNGGKIETHLGYNEIKHGNTAGDFLAKMLNGKGKVVELQGVMGTNVAQERSKGFQEAMGRNSGIKILSTQSANFDRAQGMTVMENMLQAQAQIDGVYAANDEMALGALQAIEAAKRKGIVIVSNDGTMDAFTAIKDGKIAGTMAIYPNQYGQKAVSVAVQLAKGEKVDSKIELPSIFVSKDNIDQAIVEVKK
jgi:ribose transport system substrate-binding protein